MFLYITTIRSLKQNRSGEDTDGADRFASASQIGAIGAALTQSLRNKSL